MAWRRKLPYVVPPATGGLVFGLVGVLFHGASWSHAVFQTLTFGGVGLAFTLVLQPWNRQARDHE
jgi:hypothetical protein